MKIRLNPHGKAADPSPEPKLISPDGSPLSSKSNMPYFFVTKDPDGTVFVSGARIATAPLVKITPRDQQEIAADIIAVIIAKVMVAVDAPEGPEDGGFAKTLLNLAAVPEMKRYNPLAIHYVLTKCVDDETLSIAANRPVNRVANAIATVLL